MSVALVVRQLGKRYRGLQAVAGLDLEVRTGELFGLIGPNGAGKSTTIKMIAGLVRPSAGSVEIAGLDVRSHPLAARRQLGYLPERPMLYGELTAEQTLRYSGAFYGIKPKVEQLLEQVGLQRTRRQPVKMFSKGMRQRLGLALTLVHDPAVLLLDEPFSGLDPHGLRLMRRLLRALREKKTVLLSTHRLSEVERLCGRVAVLNRGKLLRCETPAALLGYGPQRVRLEVRGADEALKTCLSGIDGVRLACQTEKHFELELADPQLKAEVAAHVVQQGLQLLELCAVPPTLEEVFDGLTRDDVG